VRAQAAPTTVARVSSIAFPQPDTLRGCVQVVARQVDVPPEMLLSVGRFEPGLMGTRAIYLLVLEHDGVSVRRAEPIAV
jgi:hypothetical protein